MVKIAIMTAADDKVVGKFPHFQKNMIFHVNHLPAE